MLQYDRQQNILDYLRIHRSARVGQLADAIFTSEASVRRDLVALEARGLVARVYGGVVLAEHKNDVVPPALRESANSEAKEIIARKAAALIRDGDTVIFDSSSTVRRICRHIKKRKNLKIITNNLRICEELKDSEVEVYLTGGELYKQRDCFLGLYAERFLQNVYADSLFFSCMGLSEEGYLTDVSEEEISMRRAMLARSRQSYFLCDSSKLGLQKTFTLCHRDAITDIISETE